MTPQISVIIPVYNGEKTILETIASVQQQTFSDFELIIINDGSTDRTLELVNSVAEPRIKIFSYSNGGLPVARNRGISHALGEYITFIDADDLWTPDKLQLQLAALQQHPEAGVAYSWTYYMDNQGKSFHTNKTVSFTGNVYPNLLLGNFLESGSNPLIRKQAIDSVGGFDSTLKYCEDWEYWLRLALRWPFVVVPKQQIIYRQTSGSMSSNIEVAEQSHLIFIERAFNSAPVEFQFLKNKSLANIYQFLAYLCLTRVPGKTGADLASQKLKTAIKIYPKILLEKKVQTLLLKLLLIKLLSPKLSSYLLEFISKLRATPIQQSINKTNTAIKN